MKTTTLIHFFKVALIPLLFFAACDKQPDYQQLADIVEKKLDVVQEDLSKRYDKHSTQITELADTESKKVFAIEYKVFDLKAKSSLEEQNKYLNELGQKRWDCFHVMSLASNARLFCKRRPTSYLRMLGKLPGVLPLVSGVSQ